MWILLLTVLQTKADLVKEKEKKETNTRFGTPGNAGILDANNHVPNVSKASVLQLSVSVRCSVISGIELVLHR